VSGNSRKVRYAARCHAPGGAPTVPTVKFGDSPATVISHDRHQIVVTTPAHAAGTVDLTIDNGMDAPLTMPSAYTYLEPYLTIAVDTPDLTIGGGAIIPTPSGSFAASAITATVQTNHPKGYKLQISTNQPNSDPHASDMSHLSVADKYLPATTHACTWDIDTKTFTDATATTPNNTWGFTLDPSNLSTQKLCQIPSQTAPLTVKSTTTNSGELGDNTVFYYGAKVDVNQLAGRYRAGIVYTAIANP
jgi:hypothetical protein